MEVVPEVRCRALSFSNDFKPMSQLLEKRLTSGSITITLLKKHMNAQYWPRLSTAVLTYVKTDFNRWTWEGDQADGVEGNNPTDIINGGDINFKTNCVLLLKQVFSTLASSNFNLLLTEKSHIPTGLMSAARLTN